MRSRECFLPRNIKLNQISIEHSFCLKYAENIAFLLFLPYALHHFSWNLHGSGCCAATEAGTSNQCPVKAGAVRTRFQPLFIWKSPWKSCFLGPEVLFIFFFKLHFYKHQALAAFRGDEVDFLGILLQFLNYTISLVTVDILKTDVSGRADWSHEKAWKKQSK